MVSDEGGIRHVSTQGGSKMANDFLSPENIRELHNSAVSLVLVGYRAGQWTLPQAISRIEGIHAQTAVWERQADGIDKELFLRDMLHCVVQGYIPEELAAAILHIHPACFTDIRAEYEVRCREMCQRIIDLPGL